MKVSDVAEIGGNGLLVGHYKRSLVDALETVYPEYPWQFRKRASTGYWDNEENVREYLLQLQQQFHLKRAEDWLEISTKHQLKNVL